MEERVVLNLPPIRCIDNGSFKKGRANVRLTVGEVYYPSKEDNYSYFLCDFCGVGEWYSKRRFEIATFEYDPNQEGDLDDDI